jgi:metal-responsive CopG/Arc/MetJ family transcriptional regulator
MQTTTTETTIGRPRGGRSKHTYGVSMTSEMIHAINEIAKAEDISGSQFIRRCINKELEARAKRN